MRDQVIYLGNFSISKMDAQSQLVIGNSMVLQQLGYKVTLIGNDSTMVKENPLESRTELPNGIYCYNVAFSKKPKYLLGNKQFQSVKKIVEFIGVNDIKYIICYGSTGFANQLFLISKFSHQNGIRILYNCVDIPELNHGSGIERLAKKADRLILHKAIAQKMDGLIAVSGFIKDYFSKQTNYPIVIIPPLKDTYNLELPTCVAERGVRTIVYVGVPFPIDGRKVEESSYKDRIDLFIDLLCSLQKKDWRLDFYGLTREQYLRVVQRQSSLIEDYRNQIGFHGRINHEDALKVVAKADYTVVYRLKSKMTMAGFSTKFVESISCGTPVIITDTSDYSSYVDRGIPSIMLDVDDEQQQRKALEEALNKSEDEIAAMKAKCGNSRLFDYRNYVEQMGRFLDEIEAI